MTQYAVERVTGESSQSRFGDSVQTTETVYVDAYLYTPTEVNETIDFGERLDGELNGLALPDEDIQVNDVFTHDAEQWQVETVMHSPSNDNRAYKRFSLTKLTN